MRWHLPESARFSLPPQEGAKESKARLLGHPIHAMLIVFPLGLLATAVAFDIVGLVGCDPEWFRISFWVIAAGIIGGLLAAVFGVIDFLAIPSGTRAQKIAVSWFLRRPEPQNPPIGAFVLSFVGVALALVTGWLGGELVYRLGVGVGKDVHVNAPSSLSGRPAKETPSQGRGSDYFRIADDLLGIDSHPRRSGILCQLERLSALSILPSVALS